MPHTQINGAMHTSSSKSIFPSKASPSPPTPRQSEDADTASSLLALTPTPPNRSSAFRSASAQQLQSVQLCSPLPQAPLSAQSPLGASLLGMSPMGLQLKHSGSHGMLATLDSPHTPGGTSAYSYVHSAAHMGDANSTNPAARLMARAGHRPLIPMSPSIRTPGPHHMQQQMQSPANGGTQQQQQHHYLRNHELQQSQSAALKHQSSSSKVRRCCC